MHVVRTAVYEGENGTDAQGGPDGGRGHRGEGVRLFYFFCNENLRFFKLLYFAGVETYISSYWIIQILGK